MLAAIIWHEIAHTEGLDERQAQQREEDLWVEFTQRGLVDTVVGLTYLAELQRRRQRGPSRAKPMSCRIQAVTWFQLALFWATNLRSPAS